MWNPERPTKEGRNVRLMFHCALCVVVCAGMMLHSYWGVGAGDGAGMTVVGEASKFCASGSIQERMSSPAPSNPPVVPTAEMWDRGAATYHKSEQLTGSYADLAVGLVAHLVKPAAADGTLRVLDVAAGTGQGAKAVVRRLAGQFPRMSFVATDISTKMLERCAECWSTDPQTSALPLQTMVADMADMRLLPDGSQDLILIIFGLLFATDPVPVIAEVMRLLSPTGVAVITTWHFVSMGWEIKPAVAHHLGRITASEEDDYHQTVLRYGREEVMRRVLRRAGLRVGDSEQFLGGHADAFMEFQRAPAAPIAVADLLEPYTGEERDKAQRFILDKFSFDGSTVPNRATSLATVIRRAIAASVR